MMDTAKTGGLIAQRRKELELTQRDLAERLHVSVQAVSKWERALSCPDIALLEPLAEILGLTVTELLSGQRGEEPGEEAVRDSLRFGLAQLKPKIRWWKWLFLVTAALLLALALGLGFVWVLDNTQLLPQPETTVRGLTWTAREFTMAHAAGKLNGYLYQVDFAGDVEKCTFQWELWTYRGLEQVWEAGEELRQDDVRHKLVAVALSSSWEEDLIGFEYGIALESPLGTAKLGLSGSLEIPSYYKEARGYAFSALEKRVEVNREEGVVLLALTVNSEGRFRKEDFAHAEDGLLARPPENGQTAYLLLRMYCQ